MNQARKTQPDKVASSASAGILLTRGGLLVLLAVMVLAAWNQQVVIVILLGLALSAAGLSSLWSRLSLSGVSCQRLLSENRAFPGETIELKLKLSNRKLIPLPWIEVDSEIPLQLLADPASLPAGETPGTRLLSHITSLLWYTSVSWRQKLDCPRRGYYKLGPVTVTSGDIFGWYPRSITWKRTDEIIVYPKIFPITHLAIPSLYPMGETVAERRIFEDPTRTIGVRDYTPQDGLRHIHWKASARHQNLQVKVFEPTTTLKVALFLAVDSFQNYGVAAEDFELGISTAASIANYLVQQRSQIGLFVNSRLPDTSQAVRILPGGSLNQLLNILEALAKVTYVTSNSFTDFFQDERGRLPWGTTVVLVISKPPEALPALLLRLKGSGCKSIVIQVGGEGDAGAHHADSWYKIRSAGEFLEFKSRAAV